MNGYEERILKAAGLLLDAAEEGIEKEASKPNVVLKQVEHMMSKVAAEEDLQSSVLTPKAIHALGLDEFLLPDPEEEAEEDAEDEEDDRQEEAEEDAEEADDDAEDDKMEAIKTAREYFSKSLALEKEATEAYNEAQVWKIASLQVLEQFGEINQDELQKIASMSYDEILK